MRSTWARPMAATGWPGEVASTRWKASAAPSRSPRSMARRASSNAGSDIIPAPGPPRIPGGAPGPGRASPGWPFAGWPPAACPRRLPAGPRQAQLLGELHHLGEVLAHLRLGQGALEQRHQLAADHGQHGGDALHLQRARQLLVRVHVHLGQHPGPVRLHGELLQDRAELLTGPAPFGPQVEDDRYRPRPVDDVCVERLLGHVKDIAALRGRRPVRTGGCLLGAFRGRLPRTQVNGAIEREVPRLLHDSYPAPCRPVIGRPTGP